MNVFEYKVNIEAETDKEAREILSAMFDLMKTTRKETSTRDFIEFAAKIKAKPSHVRTAKMFLR